MVKEVASKTLHCVEGTSDKVYQIVLESNPNGTFNVTAKWGRRGGTLQEQEKLHGVSVRSAMTQMELLLKAAKVLSSVASNFEFAADLGQAVKPKEKESFVSVSNATRRIKE